MGGIPFLLLCRRGLLLRSPLVWEAQMGSQHLGCCATCHAGNDMPKVKTGSEKGLVNASGLCLTSTQGRQLGAGGPAFCVLPSLPLGTFSHEAAPCSVVTWTGHVNSCTQPSASRQEGARGATMSRKPTSSSGELKSWWQIPAACQTQKQPPSSRKGCCLPSGMLQVPPLSPLPPTPADDAVPTLL